MKKAKCEVGPCSTCKPKRKIASTEKDTQRAILKWLETTGLLFWRQNSGGMRVGKYFVKLGTPGLPDIMVMVRGDGTGPHGCVDSTRVVGLEVKGETQKLNKNQLEMQQRFAAVGAEYRLVRTLKEAQDLVAAAIGRQYNP